MRALFYFLLLAITSTTSFADEKAYMSLKARYYPPQGHELIVREKLDMSPEALKSKSFTKSKFYELKQLKYLSIFHESQDPQKKYLVSFYFHGEPGELAVKISPVDLRKYFQQKIIIDKSKNQCSKFIQAHFEEYNRKSRVFYEDREKIEFETNEPFLEMAVLAQENSFLKKNPSRFFVITNNCRGVGNFEYEWPGIIKGHFFIPPKYLDTIMGEYDSVQLSNSSPEIPLNHISAATELRTTKFYANQIDLKGWYGFKNKFVQMYSSSKDATYQWYDLGDFDKASNNCRLRDVEEGMVKKEASTSVVQLPIQYVTGKIPYDEFADETKMKSGAIYSLEPVSYVKTPCSSSDQTKMPPNFTPPTGEPNMSRETYWEKNKCLIIPHYFVNYEDILNYPVYLSKFEIDGVYVGKSRNENSPVITPFDKSLQSDDSKRVLYHFSEFIGNYKNATLETNNNYVTVKLLNKNKNIIIGNIPLEKLIAEEKKTRYVSSFDHLEAYQGNVAGMSALFGINPQPLVDNFNSSFDPDAPLSVPVPFALVYDDNGTILNHHLPTIGIEQWYARKQGCYLVIDLVSHERMLPLARLKMEYFCQAK